MSYMVNGRNLWALTVLCLLREGPMHPYQMQRLVQQRHKDRLLDLHRGSLYNTIAQLVRAGLIEAAETGRNGRRPERTIYRLTAQGQARVAAWLRDLLATPVAEPSSFLAAVAFIARLTPAEAEEALAARAAALQAEIASQGTALREDMVARHPVLSALDPATVRVLLLDGDYLHAMRQAELAWVSSLLTELRSGSLSWDYRDITRQVREASQLAADGAHTSNPGQRME